MISMNTNLGAVTNIRNNEKQIPFDLSAKNPEVGRLLMVRGEWVWLVGVVFNLYVHAADTGEGYGDEEDSD